MCIRDSYYRVAKVHAIATRNVIRVIIDIPLQSNNNNYELYNIKSLPYYDTRLEKFLIVITEMKYIAISYDRQKFIVMSSIQAKNCKIHLLVYALSMCQ